jgi:hypothetical protein
MRGALSFLTPEVSSSNSPQKGTFFLVHLYCHFLLLLQKKVTKEKEAGKENRYCFSPIAQCHFPLQKTVTVRAFSGLPPHQYNQTTVLYPHTDLPQLALRAQC